MIVGTAGHVDHGKSALVKALTGVDPDRLAEEKRRGITIDLGFAPLDLGAAGTIGVVDVPGHEAFVRNMLAGATGVDLVLLVIAADEGVMPQTREHLAILELLGVHDGVIALTKRDLVDNEWLALVTDDVRALVAGTPLAGAAMIPTSIETGEGLDALRSALGDAVQRVPVRESTDLFRMPVDRAFTVKGTGTVVTGTVWSGQLARDAAVRVLPGNRSARVRGIQSHGSAVDAARPGTRAAIALAGAEVSDVGRGSTIVSDEAWAATTTLLADVALLESAPQTIGPRATVRFHLGTSEVGARIVAKGGAMTPGERRMARVVLDAPVIARAGDRFVLRSASPLATIGGGVVLDPLPPHRRARPYATAPRTVAERFVALLDGAGTLGVALSALPVRLGIPPGDVAAILSASPFAEHVGDHVYARPVIEKLEGRFLELVDHHHAEAPLEPGAPLQSVRARTTPQPALADLIVGTLERSGRVAVQGALVMRSGWAPTLDAAAHAARDALLQTIGRADREPASSDELAQVHGPRTMALLKLLEREGQLVQVAPDRFYATGSLERLTADLRRAMADGREHSPSELREVLGVSRKYLIPLLEYCDRTGLTERRAAGRVLGPRAAAPRPEDVHVS